MYERKVRVARFVRTSKVPPFFRENEDYGEGWTKLVDEAREEQDGSDQDAKDGINMINPVEIAEYCDKPSNVKYWKEMGAGPAAKDYQKYIKEVKCSND